VIHAALEYWDGADQDALETSAGRLVRSETEQGDVDGTRLQKEVLSLVSGFRDGELSRTFSALDIVARELPLLLLDEDGTAWRGSIDLVYRDGGQVVFADYKTDRENDDGTLRDRYSAQLGVYARALQRALVLEEPPRAELWLLRHGRRLVVPTHDAASKQTPVKPTPSKKRTKPGQQNLF
jgi:ATP-dependent exoDNAse (exonuclease V) beta subunit